MCVCVYGLYTACVHRVMDYSLGKRKKKLDGHSWLVDKWIVQMAFLSIRVSTVCVRCQRDSRCRTKLSVGRRYREEQLHESKKAHTHKKDKKKIQKQIRVRFYFFIPKVQHALFPATSLFFSLSFSIYCIFGKININNIQVYFGVHNERKRIC